VDAPTAQLLTWLDERPRSYAETIDVWHSHCPRLLVWEDALADGFVHIRGGDVLVTDAGRAALVSCCS
jgi:hypothetical protein